MTVVLVLDTKKYWEEKQWSYSFILGGHVYEAIKENNRIKQKSFFNNKTFHACREILCSETLDNCVGFSAEEDIQSVISNNK